MFRIQTKLKYFFILFVILHIQFVQGQSTFVNTNPDVQHLIERYEIRGGKFAEGVMTGIKPYTRKSVTILAEKFLLKDSAKVYADLTRRDIDNLEYLIADNWEWGRAASQKYIYAKRPIFSVLFKRKSDWLSHQTRDFDIHASPIFQFSAGNESGTTGKVYQNTRGVEIRGTINQKLGFYSQLTENQIVVPQYLRNYMGLNNAFPGEGFYKNITLAGQVRGADFFSSRAYLSFNPVRSVQVTFGHDKNVVGSGQQSIIFSDFSAPYLFLKAQTTLGRVQIMNLFTKMVNKQEDSPLAGNQSVIPPKYMVAHRLGINLAPNVNLGFYEAVVFGNRVKNRFDLDYLNPAIFYRFVEGHIGSPDNSFVGLDFKANLKKKASIYSQFILDEFVLDSIRTNFGTRLNKAGTQVGMKFIDVLGLNNFDLQWEWNRVRPYTFQHFSTYSSYVNYNQPLAHPNGANFRQYSLILRYQPIRRTFLTATYYHAEKGYDSNDKNWGGNLLRPDFFHAKIRNNSIGQGLAVSTDHLELAASYMIYHNLFLDAVMAKRTQTSGALAYEYSGSLYQVGLRMNIARRQFIF